MSQNITSQDYYKKAERLFFFSLFNLLDNFLYNDCDHIKSWHLIPTDYNIINNCFHQSCELYLKYKIKQSNQNQSFDNITAFKLPDLLNEITNKDGLKYFKKYYHKNRQVRNIDIHDINKSFFKKNIDVAISEFINTFVLFNDSNAFKRKLYKYIVIKYKNYNQYNNRYDKRDYFYIYIWLFFLIKKDLNNHNKKNIDKILNIKEIFTNNIKYFCPKCAKRSLMNPLENASFPTLDDYISFKSNEIKTFYKSKDNIYECLCCGNKIKSNLINEKNCIICQSIDNSKKTSLNYNEKCLDCSFDSEFKNIINILKNGYQENNEISPSRHFFDLTLLENEEYLERCFNIIYNTPNPKYSAYISAGTVLFTELIVNSCINYCLFRDMLINDKKLFSNKLHTKNEKKDIYINHKLNYSLDGTIEYAYFKYEEYLKQIFIKYAETINIRTQEWLLRYINNVSWYSIFLIIHKYYGIVIENEKDYEDLEIKYFNSNINEMTKKIII